MSSENGIELGQNAFEEAKAKARKDHGGKQLLPLVERMNKMRVLKGTLEAQLRDCNAEYDVLRFELVPERMELDGVENVRYEGIGRVSLTPDMLVAVRPGMKDQLFEWLRTKKLGDLIQPGINPSTLKAFVKERHKKGLEYPGDFLNVQPITRASITKA